MVLCQVLDLEGSEIPLGTLNFTAGGRFLAAQNRRFTFAITASRKDESSKYYSNNKSDDRGNEIGIVII
jgi:hypothetical protein